MPTKAKKKTTASVKRPAISSKKAAEDQSIKLSKQVDKHKKTIQSLKSQIKEQEALSKSRDELKTEVDALSQTKSQLEVYITRNSSKEKAFDKIIKDLTGQKNDLDKYIDKVGPKKKSLEAQLHELEKEKQGNLAQIEGFSAELVGVQGEIEGLQQSKDLIVTQIEELEHEYGLYPRDLKGMFKDSKTQLRSYAGLAIGSAAITLTFAALMLGFLFRGNPFMDQVKNQFADQPNLQFFSMLAVTLVSIVVFSFLIYLFFNLTKGFISQYIDIRNKVTSLRVTDFLMSKLENDKSGKGRDKKTEQTDLTNKYISEIMRFDNSFRKS